MRRSRKASTTWRIALGVLFGHRGFPLLHHCHCDFRLVIILAPLFFLLNFDFFCSSSAS
jgi:hypothetical protein